MGFYEPGICIDSFEPDADGLIRVRRHEVDATYDIGDVVPIDDSDLLGFARVVRYEGDPDFGWICLEELHGTEANHAAEELELSYEGWCDPLDDYAL